MPGWEPRARSHATAILSNEVSALVHMVDTPELSVADHAFLFRNLAASLPAVTRPGLTRWAA